MYDLIFGFHSINSILKKDVKLFVKVYVLHTLKNKLRGKFLIQTVKKNNINIKLVNKKFLDQKSNNMSHQGFIALIKKKKKINEKNLSNILSKFKLPFLLILDHITDPHNLGACIRNADATGVDMIIIPKNRSAHINATVKKVSSGASEHILLMQVTNLAKIIRFLRSRNIFIIGTDSKSNNNVFDLKIKGPIALIIGSEDTGLRLLTKKLCDIIVSIPMKGYVSSLNTSVACGICLFEIFQKKMLLKIKN